MQKANSYIFNSPGSSLAKSFLTATGVSGYINKKVTKPSVTHHMGTSYSERVREHARKNGPWAAFADDLHAHVTEDGDIAVTFQGSDDDRKLVEMLEYGTPSNPPRSVMRVMEEELRQQYIQDSKRYLQ